MKKILQLEELAQMALGIIVLDLLPVEFSWWAWLLLFLSPDISFAAYFVNTRVGAFAYNIFHHKGIALTIAIAGFLLKQDIMLLAGALLFAHSSFDRLLGYGLKYKDDFKHTHLGWMK
ncbi:DUF4260 domain-containing protein [Terrimonas alba]|uniref:DUF4260 domain-containing protein n=1 Tax=Terrimonas alba TaxID=3349636 RepID=UPI0035F24252